MDGPLAERMRPRTLDEIVGQAHLIGPDAPLRRVFLAGKPYSMVLWGPPGSGKTTLARVLAQSVGGSFLQLSAVLSGVAELRAAVKKAEQDRALGLRTLLFVDEVHRFNKAQQDAFLPHLESGLLVFIGATTENPAFELNAALLSRARVHVLKPLVDDDLVRLLQRALDDGERGLGGHGRHVDATALTRIAQAADGDARRALTLLELAIEATPPGQSLTDSDLETVLSGGGRRFDKRGDAYYDQISALHKCVRSSHPDAALYWFCRMLDGGADPLYLGRRLLRMASEDIGLADPRALSLCLDALATYERLGSPEGELALAEAVLYLAVAPKSNAVYRAYGRAVAEVARGGSLEVPLHLRNAPTRLARALGHGAGYQYDHDLPDAIAYDQRGFPEALGEPVYYEPSGRGLEARIQERLAEIRRRRQGS